MTKGPKQIALVFPLSVPYMERITRGMMDYSRKHGPWQMVFSPEAVTTPLELLRAGDVDGIMAMVSSTKDAARLAAVGVPAVNLASALRNLPLPSVTVENRAVGRLAAAHLIQRGFRRFAYYGVSDTSFGQERGEGFGEALKAAGYSCSVCFARSGIDCGRPSLVDRGQLRTWLRRLRPPVGLLAVHDHRARVVLELCASLGLKVPDDVAVVGVGDDVVACELSTPSLTSIALPGFEIGYRGAELLDQLMKGAAAPREPIRVAPTEVVCRRSTDILAFGDHLVAEIVRLIHERLQEPLNVAQVAGEAKVSRRLLERRFKATVGLTPHEYICRVRVNRAKRLLIGVPFHSLKEVAGRCGFTDARRMNLAFKRVEGITPQEYRRRQVHS